jgi:hypothetical protein
VSVVLRFPATSSTCQHRPTCTPLPYPLAQLINEVKKPFSSSRSPISRSAQLPSDTVDEPAAADLERLPPPHAVMSPTRKAVDRSTRRSHRTDRLSVHKEFTVDSRLPSSSGPPATAVTSARAPRSSTAHQPTPLTPVYASAASFPSTREHLHADRHLRPTSDTAATSTRSPPAP